jgi:hypothetical protein
MIAPFFVEHPVDERLSTPINCSYVSSSCPLSLQSYRIIFSGFGIVIVKRPGERLPTQAYTY